MDLLNYTPSKKHLMRLYYELSLRGANTIGEKKPWPFKKFENEETFLVTASLLSRFDPRIFGVLVEFFYNNWQRYNPYHFRLALKQMSESQCFAVILNFVLSDNSDEEFKYFYQYITQDLKPVSYQLYFKNLYQPAGYNMMRAAAESLSEFSQWGFLSRERPILYSRNRKRLGHWNSDARENIANRLLSKSQTLTLSDYLKELDFSISRQQALMDLKNNSKLKLKGKKRGAYWVFCG